VRVPLDSVWGADTVVTLRRDWVVMGNGSALVVEDISPASVRLRLQPTLSSLVPLRVRTVGALPDGMALAAPLGLNPQVARVRGAAPRVRGLDSISLEALDLTSVSASGIYNVAVDTAGLAGVTVSPMTATIGLRLEPATERVLAGVPVLPGTSEGETPPELDIEPATIQVRLLGARTPVGGTRLEQIQAVVPREAWQGLVPGEERRVPIRLRGLPVLVRGFSAVDSVTVRWDGEAASDSTAAGADSAGVGAGAGR
jgi:YbbR domain-containing protein